MLYHPINSVGFNLKKCSIIKLSSRSFHIFSTITPVLIPNLDATQFIISDLSESVSAKPLLDDSSNTCLLMLDESMDLANSSMSWLVTSRRPALAVLLFVSVKLPFFELKIHLRCSNVYNP